MKTLPFLIWVIILSNGLQAQLKADTPIAVESAFDEDCDRLLLRKLYQAEKEISVAIYTLTNRKIAGVLTKRHEDGLKIDIKYDAGQYEEIDSMKSLISDLEKSGIPCRAVKLREDHARMHHKFVVIDQELVLTGSFNFTYSATSVNKENLVAIRDSKTAARFLETFRKL
jgi:phosphatidylserine/phosphatidylglycerophosphate/cardiolipin synthase-like enzyme